MTTVLSAARGSGATHDAVDAAVSHSLDDLTGPEAAAFVRLAVFPSWFTLAAARDVVAGGEVETDAVPVVVRNLVDRALALIDARDPDGQRYRLLPAVHDITLRRLEARNERDAILRRHASHYLSLAEQGARRLAGRASEQWVKRLTRERSNFHTAARWASHAGERSLA